MQTTTAVQR